MSLNKNDTNVLGELIILQCDEECVSSKKRTQEQVDIPRITKPNYQTLASKNSPRIPPSSKP